MEQLTEQLKPHTDLTKEEIMRILQHYEIKPIIIDQEIIDKVMDVLDQDAKIFCGEKGDDFYAYRSDSDKYHIVIAPSYRDERFYVQIINENLLKICSMTKVDPDDKTVEFEEDIWVDITEEYIYRYCDELLRKPRDIDDYY
jgi:hypothetical protein